MIHPKDDVRFLLLEVGKRHSGATVRFKVEIPGSMIQPGDTVLVVGVTNSRKIGEGERWIVGESGPALSEEKK